MTLPDSFPLEFPVHEHPLQWEERGSRKDSMSPLHHRAAYEDISADKIAKKNRNDLLTSLIWDNNGMASTQETIQTRDSGNTQLPPLLSIADNVPWMLMQARITTETNSLKNTAAASEHATKTIEMISKANQTALAGIICKENEATKMSFWSRLFKFVTGVVQLISAAVVLATVGITGAGVAVAAFLLIQGANDLWNAASGEQENWIAAGVSKIARSFGASKELADKIGMGVNIALAVITAIAPLGMGAGGVASIAGNTVAMTRLLTASLKVVQSAASFVSGVGLGVTGIITANITRDVTDIEARVTELRAEIDLQQKFQKFLTKNAQYQMSSFTETMQNLTDFLLSTTDINKKFIRNLA
ncbi:MAG: hypothetical protein PW790_11125 [Parvibaculaceae bacterium]|nr:hypothetical protein [Parvibaculaceae bacterium]